VYRAGPRGLEGEFVVADGADPASIRVRSAGRADVSVDAPLQIETANGRLVHPWSVTRREAGWERRPVAGTEGVEASDEVTFEVATRTDETIGIDPVVQFATYLGGRTDDRGFGIALDSTGSIYIAGHTSSVDFPLRDPLHLIGETVRSFDGFVTKLSPDANAVVYSTYLGGNGTLDACRDVALDVNGDIHVAGFTDSTDFPTVNAPQPQYNGGQADGFVAVLSAAGDQLTYATYLGGDGADSGRGLALDDRGNIHVAGLTTSTDFPVTQALFPVLRGDSDGFVSTIAPDGRLAQSTYLGGATVTG
jgi:hypothetical protein